MNQTIEELKGMFKQGDLLTKLIFINSGIFVIVALVDLVLFLFNVQAFSLEGLLALPASLQAVCYKPWTLVTYMFLHKNFIHFIFNMLMLYWMGRIFLMTFYQRDLVNLYIFGGLVGGIVYILCFNVFPGLRGQAGHTILEGASAAIIAILVAAAVDRPEMPLRLALIGEIRLKWIALILVGISVLTDYASNMGGCIAHLGGALGGFLFAYYKRKGINITNWIGAILDFFPSLWNKLSQPSQKKAKFKVVYNRDEVKDATPDETYNMRKKNEKDEIDAILDKIKVSGYDGLTAEEKAKLFNASKS